MVNGKQFGLHDSYGFWITRLANVFRAAFERSMAPLGVTPPQWGILISLYNEDAGTPAELAKFMAIDGSAVTRTLDQLEEKGMLARVPDRQDRRSIKIELTARGRELAPKLATRAEEVSNQFFSGIPPAEVAQFKATIFKMLESSER